MKQGRGFTLIEIAVVLLLIGIIMAAGVRYLNSQLTSATYSASNTKLATIKDALTTYLGKNKRLPCPDDPGIDPALGGLESRDTNAHPCTNFMGVLPYKTLGLSQDSALDGWGNYFSYGVTASNWVLTLSTVPPDNQYTTDATKSFGPGSQGGLIVMSRLSDNGTSTLTSNAAVVVISHGKNGAGGYTIKGTQNVVPDSLQQQDEFANTVQTNTTFWKREYSESDDPPYGAFDDLVLVIQPDDLITPLTKDGTLSSAYGSLNQTFALTANDVLSYAFQHQGGGPSPLPITYSLPPSGPMSFDPWGTPLDYVLGPGITSITSSTPDGVAYTLTSHGPDKLTGTSATLIDDVTYTVTVSQLKAFLAKTGF